LARDFTYKAYRQLLQALKKAGYQSIKFEDYIKGQNLPEKLVILRHDVDRLPWNALDMARIEKEEGMVASYYYRVVPEAYNEEVIKQVTALGNECGYHYEDMDLAKGDIDKAYQLYLTHLQNFRRFYPVCTVCMHGSPMSPWDNREVWTKYDVHAEGIIGEPFLDLDYSKIFYITDTGRSWNNKKVSVRDKVNTPFNFAFQSTFHFIDELIAGKLPSQIMFNTHPNRWNDKPVLWMRELVMQNIKNIAKAVIARRRIAQQKAAA